MKKIFSLLIIILVGTYSKAQNPTFQWVKTFGASGGVKAIYSDVDGSKNIVSTGVCSASADFDPSAGVFNLISGDVFITKLDSLGNFLWGKNLAYIVPYSIATDLSDNIYIVGTTSFIADLDPGVATYTTSYGVTGGNIVFILKLDASGNFVWGKYINALDAKAIKLDLMGNVYVTGRYSGVKDFDTGPGIYNLTSGSSSMYIDVYVLKLDNFGNFIWAKSFGGNDNNYGHAVAVDKLGNVYTTGFFYGTVDFDPGSVVYNLSGSSVVLSKLDSNGGFVWAKKITDGAFTAQGFNVEVDKSGNVYTAGIFSSFSDFDPGPTTYTADATGHTAIFVSKLDPLGNFNWVKFMGGGNYSKAYSMLLDNQNNVYTTGTYMATGSFGGTPNLVSAGNEDVFISKLDSNGTFVWAKSIGGNGLDNGYSINIDASSNIYTSGFFGYTADFDPSIAVFNITGTTAHDFFIHKMKQCDVPLAPINITPVSNQAICINSSTTLSVSATGMINWYATPSSTLILGTGLSFITPALTTGTYTYYAQAITCTVSASRTAITVSVNPNCQDVWPGDANSDGLADNLDVLELGLHYTQTGAARAITSNVWQSYFANNWTGTITNGKNLNHSDCNGDGTINDNDTLAIYNNYGLTHAFKTAQTTTVNPQLSIVPDQAAVVKGTWGTASIYLGDAITSINNINGIAFTVDFDNTLIETNSIYMEYQNSFLDAGQNLRFRKLDFTNSKLYTATTHTVNNNVSGNGLIAKLHYQVKSTITTDQVLNLGISQANQSDASGAILPLTSSTGTLMAMGTSVGLQELNGNIVSISPNPTNGLLTINSKTELQKIEVVSVTGQLLLSEIPTNVSHTLHLENFSNGIYFVNVYQNDRIVKREKIVLNK